MTKMKTQIGYHGNGKELEGFDRLNKGDLLRVYLGNTSFLCKLINTGKIGLDLEIYVKDLATNCFALNEGFVSYEAIMGFTKLNEDELKTLFQREPVINQYLGRYIRLEGPNPHLWGKLEEICSEGVFLRPHLHVDLDTGNLNLDCKNKLYVGEQYLKLITPSAKRELRGYIKRMNKKITDSKK